MPERARASARAFLVAVLLVTVAVPVSGQGLPSSDDIEDDETEQQLPDLIVYSAGARPSRPHEAQEFEVCTNVQNYGQAQPNPFTVALVWDGSETFYERFEHFPREGADICVNMTAAAGWYPLEVFVDVEEEVRERAEANNYRRVFVEVTEEPLPDLRVNVSMNPDPPRRGETFAVVATIHNVGNAVAGNFSVDFFWNDGHAAHRAIAEGLAPGDRRQAVLTADADWLAAGNHSLRVEADRNGYLREKNRDNNIAERDVTVPRLPKPEIGISSATVPANITDGHVLNVTARITNFGDKPTGPFVVRFLLDGVTTVGLPRIENLAPLRSVNVSTTWAARDPGPHLLSIIADANRDVVEDTEENNAANFTFNITPRFAELPRPDLIVERILTSPYPAVEGEPVSLTAVLQNVGTVASPAANASFTVNGEHLGTRPVAELPVGGYVASTMPWSGGPGVHEVVVTVDVDDAMEEADESNNTRRVTFTVYEDAEAARLREEGRGNDTGPEPEPDGNGTEEPPVNGTPGSDPGGIMDRDEAPIVLLEVVHAGYLEVVQGKRDPRLVGRVVNRGNAVASPFVMQFHLDGRLVGEREVPGLGPERDIILSWGAHMDPEWTPPTPGDHSVRIVVIREGESGPGPLEERREQFTVANIDDEQKIPGAGVPLALAAGVAVALATARRRVT